MKKYLKLIGLLLIIIIIGSFIYSRFYSTSEIPNFEYKTIYDEKFTKDDIKKSAKKIVFIYFSCKCDDCKKIINDIEKFRKIQNQNQIILITTEKDIKLIKNFVKHEELNQLKIPILVDNNNNFPSDFSLGISIDLPKVIVFDENRKLSKQINSLNKLNL